VILVDHVTNGEVVLFLGSGASIGAIHPDNVKIPTGTDLAKAIANKFLGPGFEKRSLADVAELAMSETTISEVQEFVASLFIDYAPCDFHKLIPTFAWTAIATTNYDLILERAYQAVASRRQNLVVFKKNSERVEDKLKTPNSVIFLKLHGCITDINDENVPLILTPDQYITHLKGRHLLFNRLEEYAYQAPMIFVGHSLSDPDLRAVLLKLDQLGQSKPRSYLVAPEITDADMRLWGNRKIHCLRMTFRDFLLELDGLISKTSRVLSIVPRDVEYPIFNKCAISETVKPSQSLLTFLSRDVTHVGRHYKAAPVDPKEFYKGYFVDWAPILQNLDVRRPLSDIMMSEIFLASEEERPERVDFYMIKGHAGSGKTVILRRLAWDAANEFDKICISLKPSSHPEFEPLNELCRLAKERVFLFIDPVSEYVDTIEYFITRARKEKIPLTIIGAERANEWNEQCDNLAPYVNRSYELKYLSEREIEHLIELLAKNKSLGYLEEMNPAEQKAALAKKAGRQLLVALYEATSGKPFRAIVLDEFRSITNRQAQSLYLTVCILHRLGVPARAGMISRVHQIPLSLFKEHLFKPLEFIVFASKNETIGDYEYRSRHSQIAEMVFEEVLVNPQDRYDEYIRIINAIDVGYNSDRSAFKGLTNARQLLSLFPNPHMIRQIYTAARNCAPDDPMLLQQEAIFEMLSTDGSLDKATNLLQKAHKIVPKNVVIAHSLSELALKKSNKATNPLEKIKFREESRKISLELAGKGSMTGHPQHTLIKIGLEELAECMEKNDPPIIERKIKELDKLISEAIQAFPDSSFILELNAEYCELVNKNPAALQLLIKAFKSNKRSPYIASRLAQMYEHDNRLKDAIDVLRECVEANPSDKHVNFKLAMLISRLPDSNTADILHHFRRSFTDGDSNYAAQFWYARLLYLTGDRSKALEVFARLSQSNIDTRLKHISRGLVMDKEAPIRFNGTIAKMESSYGLIKRDGPQDSILMHRDYSDEDQWKHFRTHMRVSFALAFQYSGAIGVNVQKEA